MCIGHLLTSISQITSPNITHPPTTAECANTSSTPLLAQSSFQMHQLDVLQGVLIPNHDYPNGYPTVRPAELQSVTLSHQVDTHKTLTTHKLACSCFVAPFGHQQSKHCICILNICNHKMFKLHFKMNVFHIIGMIHKLCNNCCIVVAVVT